MAEVFLGEAISVQGFKKRVAIKRVLPHLASNQSFIGMFLDEARLCARLSHANVVSVFDIGQSEGTYFLVMEYVDGCDLKAVMSGLREQEHDFPVPAALYIAMETCRGLSYAHELHEDGRPLGLVHRDVSPPNVLLSRRGEVKVTDFGLAKASTQLEQTDPGIVKGKFGYLSPQTAAGEQVDARADIYAVGIVLWELLAGRRLFLGDSDYATVQKVRQGEVPSLAAERRDVDSELDAIVQKALARELGDRFQSARELGDALAGYLFSRQLKVTAYDVANLVRSTLADVVRLQEPTEPRQSIERLIQEELRRFTSLEDMSESDPTDPKAARRGNAGDAFENPADWFKDDDVVGDALEAVASDVHGAVPEAPRWREAAAAGPPPAKHLSERPTDPVPATGEDEPASGRDLAAAGGGASEARASSSVPLGDLVDEAVAELGEKADRATMPLDMGPSKAPSLPPSSAPRQGKSGRDVWRRRPIGPSWVLIGAVIVLAAIAAYMALR